MDVHLSRGMFGCVCMMCVSAGCQEVLSSLGWLAWCASVDHRIPPETNSLTHSRTDVRHKNNTTERGSERKRERASRVGG